MAQEPHIPTTEMKAKVAALSAFGVSQVKIADYFSLSTPTLVKYYKKELDTAMVDKNLQVATALFQNALDGNVTAQLFWLKCRAGWREVDKEENKQADINKIQIEILDGKGEVKDV